MTPDIYIVRLLQATGKKLNLLNDMLSLTRAQSNAIKEEALDALEGLTVDKQNLIDQIDELDEEFNVYFQRLKQQLGIKSLDELQNPNIQGIGELKQVVGRIMEVIKEIAALEQQNNANAKALLDELGREVRRLNQGKKVSNAYTSGYSAQPSSYFIDKKE